ncbi:MAG: DUF4845 domain-containing protein [Gammaproteobacteria bacterium]|nr:DUF4845 domain-containing protein [Gammaproteobacteria bacterium]MDH3450097.1 DUF4845 domain-containing protein [Gammaproteobacteria bacterium]
MKRTTNMRRRQKGLSTAGWLLVAGIFGLLIISFFKVFPMYYGNFKLKSALEALQQDTDVDPKSKGDIWQSLQKRLFVNEVRNITREHVTMERKDGRTTVTVTYEVRDDYIGNLFIGARFAESIVIDR